MTLTDPLTSDDISSQWRGGPAAHPAAGGVDADRARPLALQGLRPVPDREIPAYTYDPVQQIAVGPDGDPLVPAMAKDWTSYESTHTDGDGGDNEAWGWEEQ